MIHAILAAASVLILDRLASTDEIAAMTAQNGAILSLILFVLFYSVSKIRPKLFANINAYLFFTFIGFCSAWPYHQEGYLPYLISVFSIIGFLVFVKSLKYSPEFDQEFKKIINGVFSLMGFTF